MNRYIDANIENIITAHIKPKSDDILPDVVDVPGNS